jgi:xanthine phosphoribosyltransferase
MKLLQDRIREEGVIKEGNVLKVDMFLNHQMDVGLFRQMAKEWKKLFADAGVNKILTIEASGIGIACIAAEEFGCKVVFAKKTQGKNLDGELYTTQITSFTKGRVFDVIVEKKFLGPEDRVLIIDDFLANGCALEGLIQIVRESGAELVGCGIAIEKGFQAGGAKIRSMGVRLESLAIIESMSPEGGIVFRD